jgi:hypothetical protein
LSTVVKHFTDGTFTITDGAALSLVVRFCVGDFSISGLKAKLRETAAYQARGVLTSVRHGARTFPTFTFTAQMAEFTDATSISTPDAILKNGAWSSAQSTRGVKEEVHMVNFKVTEDGVTFGDAADPEFELEDCELELSYAQGEPNTFSVTGTMYGAVTGDLATS